jgi:predicted nucleic acid-binding protein
MKLVLDTNAIAYMMLKTEPYHLALCELLAKPHSLYAPASWQAEFANVLWLAAKARVIESRVIGSKLRLALGLGIENIAVSDLWESAVALALDKDHPVYDTLFVELARRLHSPLITYDQMLARKFPDVARQAGDLMARR